MQDNDFIVNYFTTGRWYISVYCLLSYLEDQFPGQIHPIAPLYRLFEFSEEGNGDKLP